MKLIVGLGNPGKKYKNNRHNVGFMVVDGLAMQLFSYKDIQPEWKESKKSSSLIFEPMTGCVLVKPQTFMNASGNAVKKLVDWFKVKLEDLYIIHDDLDIPLGQYKIQKGKGPKLHYGIKSIDEALGTRDYWRVRVGIENRRVSRVAQVPRVPRGEEYVLQNFTQEEKSIIADVIERIITDLNGRF